MCRRLIINAGLAKVICRTGKDSYTVTDVQEWINADDTLHAEQE
jgi:dCMP deaminase